MEHRQFNAYTLETKQDGDIGIVTAFISTFGNIDLVDDVVSKDAFDKTLSSGRTVRVLDNHNSHSVLSVCGRVIALEAVKQRSQLPLVIQQKDSAITGGIKATIQFLLQDRTSSEIFFRIKNGLVSDWSIGYRVIKSHFDTIKNRSVRVLDEIELLELSSVIFPANPAAATVDAKGNHDKRQKGLQEIDAIISNLNKQAAVKNINRQERIREIGLIETEILLQELEQNG